ncbi:AraC family transcriptional regulator [Vibrio caribbeanicus]|uniref:AraC-type DNA-binding domain-containing protein n=1 Tax=Vibrio caribbeanicus ATCC BAA-2122 TaxID=796620 RepID=E3BEE4_9VIBR|nr:helix-turn-helix transcriptional regulator [Vibrio caribbeanicus]EFP98561.1 AraC-type DNA-binding domain-containing protein [Vibrio caribbeanicus ATCC BAA-2122]
MANSIPSGFFNPDAYQQTVVALRLTEAEQNEVPFHQHRKGQLVMPLSGFVKSRIEDAIWMVPRHCAVWIPSKMPHSNYVASRSDICMLFVDPDIEGLPEKTCTLSVSPLLRELVVKLASEDKDYDQQGRVGRLAEVLIDELVSMPTERFEFPIPSEPRLNKLAYWMLEKPNNQTSIKLWAQRLAMSDRTLSRLVKQELGMTFGQWRAQLHVVVVLQKLSQKETVQRISEDLGYESVSAFITFFKKMFGKPPAQYMKGFQ